MRKSVAHSIASLIILAIVAGPTPCAGQDAAPDDVPEEYGKYFEHYSEDRSRLERWLNRVGFSKEDSGPALALIVGVSKYPHMRTPSQRHLRPVEADIARLVRVLKSDQAFSEIVVLRDEAVSEDNLRYFLQVYFPRRLRQLHRPRFLLTYSGHGFAESNQGFLLQSSARSFDDVENSISMEVLRSRYSRILSSAHQSLALINACHSGHFEGRQSFGDSERVKLIPQNTGHHTITAGGSTELAWHDPQVGPGSVFFETVIAALDQRADKYPQQSDGSWGDGIVTFHELAAYVVTEIQFATDNIQNPRPSDIAPNGSKSGGSFFFFDRTGASRSSQRRVVPTVTETITMGGPSQPREQLDLATATETVPTIEETETVPTIEETETVATIEETATAPTIEAVQEQLRRLDLYLGPIDGRMGPASDQAVRDYANLLGRSTVDLFDPMEFVSLSSTDSVYPVIPLDGAFRGFSCDVSSVGGEWASTMREDISRDLYGTYGCSEPPDAHTLPGYGGNFHSSSLWSGFAWRSSVLYYDDRNARKAHALARDLSLRYGHRFFASRGAGLGIREAGFSTAIVVHVRERGM